MRGDINAVAIAAKALGIPVDPAERAAHLLIHRKQIARGLIDIDEVDDDAMRTGAKFCSKNVRALWASAGRTGEALRHTSESAATMDP